MKTKHGSIHLEIQSSRKNPVGIIRSTFWDKTAGMNRHEQHGRITGCSLEELQMLQAAFRGEVIPKGDDLAFRILDSRELGASMALLKLAKELELNRILYSRSVPWVDCVLAMIIGRIVFQGSKLSLCNRSDQTALWELCGVEEPLDVEKHCYKPLDKLLERQNAIQKNLARRHLKSGSLVLYDITSTYFEGEYEDSELVAFGYNRDRKKGHEQVVVGLITNEEGCPVGCEVFKGNTNDSTTVADQIDKIRGEFGVDQFIFVGDRGMVTQGNFEQIRQLENASSISALTHAQLRELIERNVVQPDLFDEMKTLEIVDTADPQLRYCLCKNPHRKQQDHDTRQRLIELTKEGLSEIAAYKKKTTVDQLGARVGKLLAKYKTGKYIHWSVTADPDAANSINHQLNWTVNEEKIAHEEQLDGCYVIRTDAPADQLSSDRILHAYKSLGHVERAFRHLKTVQLDIRPVYHKTDDRIRAHIFLCMLAYYLQWHMMQRLQPLFETDGEGADRKWTLKKVIDTLKQRCRHTIKHGKIIYQQNGESTPDQRIIEDLLSGAVWPST